MNNETKLREYLKKNNLYLSENEENFIKLLLSFSNGNNNVAMKDSNLINADFALMTIKRLRHQLSQKNLLEIERVFDFVNNKPTGEIKYAFLFFD